MPSRVVSAQDLDKPIVAKKSLSASNDGTMRTVIDTEFGTVVTDEPIPHGGAGTAPSPLQIVLAALCGCEGITSTAQLRSSISPMKESTSGAHTRSTHAAAWDREVRPHFQTVRLEARVFTSESAERLCEVVEETEARCPVFNLISDANVKIETLWICEEID